MNYNLNTTLLLISTSLNILFLLFVILIISRKGGIFYIKNKILTIGKKNIQNNLNINSYYKHKKSQFEILPRSNDYIVFLGDSITDEGEWVELLGNSNIVNRGISGDTTRRILNRLDAIVRIKPKQIFIMVGINDFVNEKKSIEEVLSQYKIILEELQAQTPQTQVFLQSVLPVNNNLTYIFEDNQKLIQFNSRLQKLAAQFNYQYIDVFSSLADAENQLDARYTTDGLHLNGKAYLVWKDVVKKYVALTFSSVYKEENSLYN
ncbi:GDSL-type esterase/lipase family protein [Rivularia sp. PCC 7116]|uniref:GDSL-type esterase/lipase family protein n=1 Tax=Rivularia sp. PCC 7116 TaxID=373994 RepID=UPI00031E8253|nr:GDSL-type esterase/lipase family protein [Rivularia sp. PCC 7116]